MIKDQTVVMTRGHYKGRPGIITEVNGSTCTVVLTDTVNYPRHADVTIYNVKSSDYRRS